MNWLKKIFTPKGDAAQTSVAGRPEPRQLRPRHDMPVTEAKRISTENVRQWCDKLEAEADRTGNNRLRAQAANIRARLT